MRGVFSVEVPFAAVIPLSEWHVIQECHPRAVFSHFSAIMLHGLSAAPPSRFVLTQDAPSEGARLPPGTTPDDWAEIELPRGFALPEFNRKPVSWRVRRGDQGVGVCAVQAEAQVVWATDLERTLIDVVDSPDDSGGVMVCTEAWRNAARRLSPDRMIRHVEKMGGGLRRQRIGFLLEHIGVRDGRLDVWQRSAKRGGSARLIASREFAPEHSERWKLSLNVPPSVLELIREPARG